MSALLPGAADDLGVLLLDNTFLARPSMLSVTCSKLDAEVSETTRATSYDCDVLEDRLGAGRRNRAP